MDTDRKGKIRPLRPDSQPVTLSGTVPLPTGAATEATLQAIAGLLPDAFDYVSCSYPTTTQEVYVYKTGGSGGTTVATITVNYTNDTKEYITDIIKT